ncbi:hypothetical protein SERLA73DRAFT_160457 [Serpula lacrymans var. lacrymans S7.3]|uniref:Uncharacterized protein n=1 Tax=Serpula lacrymans var. lacrymans (strain S7.3) TaxID=936435 RepID=F8PY34_SERL3|nr:hypothetical protein SERLA73DRAFT_160457 [Serpula lacrymans var. lacrymans S7.3]
MADAQKRQRERGWDDIRSALSVTVCAWIMRAIIASGLTNAHQSAVEFLKRAIEVIETGRSVWKDASKEQRGTIFEDSFSRGVHTQYLEIYKLASHEDCAAFPLDTIYEEADDLIKETRANPLSTTAAYDPGFISSFSIYPIGVGLSMKGYYHAQSAKLAEDKIAEQLHHYWKAAEFYMEAASVYPEDDENHVWYLHCALTNMWKCGTPLRTTLDVLKRIRDATPKMLKIWVDSTAAKAGRDQALKTDMEALEALLMELEAGNVSLDDPIIPQWV